MESNLTSPSTPPTRPILTCFPPSPNWYSDSIATLDSELGLFYYGAVDSIYILDLTDLSYITSWVSNHQRITTLTILNTPEVTSPRLVSGGEDGKVKLWLVSLDYKLKYEVLKPVREHTMHKKKVSYVLGTTDGNRVISGDASGKLVIWNLIDDTHESNQLSQSKIISMDTITYSSTTEVEEVVAVGFDNGTILIVSLQPSTLFQIKYRVSYTGTKPLSLKWIRHNDIPVLAASFNDHSIRIWMDYQSNIKPKRITVPSIKKGSKGGGISWVGLNWSHSLNQIPCLIFASNGGRLYSWELGTDPNKLKEFASTCRNTGHNRAIYSLICYTTKSGSRIITHSQDRRIIIWNYNQGTIQTSISTLGGPARSIDFPNFQPNLAAVGVADSAIRLWSYQLECFAPSNCSKSLWKTESSSVTRVLFHPELEGVLAFGTGSGLIAIFETIYDIIPMQLTIPDPIKLNSRNRGTVIGLQWVKWDRIILSNQLYNNIEQDDLNDLLGLLDDNEPSTVTKPSSESYALISLDVTGFINCNFYKASTQKLSPLFHQSATEKIQQFAFALHHPWVALGYKNDTIKVFSMPDYTLIYHSTGKLGAVVSLAWSIDESTLAVGHSSGIITLHTSSQFISPGEVIAVYPYPESRLTGHAREINSLQWSPHHQHQLVSSSLDGSTIVWDITSDAKKLATFFTHTGSSALCSRFCPLDPTAIITGAEDNSVWIWDLSLYPPVTRKLPTKRKESTRELTTNNSKKLKRLVINEPTRPVVPPTNQSLQDLLGLTSTSQLIDSDTNELPSFFTKLWSGQVVDAITESSTTEDLTNLLLPLALSPLAGPDVYSHMLLQTAHQLQTNLADPRISASLLVAVGQITEAMDLLVTNHRYPDAITLCKLRFPSEHRHLTELYVKYAEYLLGSELYEESCKYYLLGNQPTTAITTIALRNTRDSLLVALNLAHQYQDPTLDVRIWRYIGSCLMEQQYQLALDKLSEFDVSVAIASYWVLVVTDQWRSTRLKLSTVTGLDPKLPSTLPSKPDELTITVLKTSSHNPDMNSNNPDVIDMDLNNPDGNDMDLDNPGAIDMNLGNLDATDVILNNPDVVDTNLNNPDAIDMDLNNPDVIDMDLNNPDVIDMDLNNPDVIDMDLNNPDVIDMDLNNPDAIEMDLDNPDAFDMTLDNPETTNKNLNNPDVNELENSEEINLDTIPSNIDVPPSVIKLEPTPTNIDPKIKRTLVPSDLQIHWQTHGITLNSDLIITIHRPQQSKYEGPLLTLVDYLRSRPQDLASEGQLTIQFLHQLSN